MLNIFFLSPELIKKKITAHIFQAKGAMNGNDVNKFKAVFI